MREARGRLGEFLVVGQPAQLLRERGPDVTHREHVFLAGAMDLTCHRLSRKWRFSSPLTHG